jgi:arylsulfatase A-like enzyme
VKKEKAMRSVLVLLGLFATTVLARPNIVWIMSDDLGYGEVGSFPAGSVHGRLATPNLDKFAAQGKRT